jgi:hypothetical protein
MHSLILYSSYTRVSFDAQPLETPGGGTIYIRVERVPYDIDDALDRARPIEGEIVLNTVVWDGIKPAVEASYPAHAVKDVHPATQLENLLPALLTAK